MTKKGLSRRDFLKTAAALTGGGLLTACTPRVVATDTPQPQAQVVEQTAEMDGPNAQPIPPVSPPTNWDEEADIVIVGAGGAGLAAAVYTADKGMSVIVTEKMLEVGGGTKNAAVFIAPGNRYSVEAGITYDEEKFFNDNLMLLGYTIDQPLLRTLLRKGSETVHWMADLGAEWQQDPLGLMAGVAMVSWKDSTAGLFYPRAMEPTVNFMYEKAQEKGVKFLLTTTVSALVRDGDRIVGVKAETADGTTKYVKANKAVLLAAGGFANNKDMLKKYTPTAYLGCPSAFAMPGDTGEVIRMGIGAGAALSGFNSFIPFDGGMDFAGAGGDFFHYLYNGDLQLVRHPWLSINREGERYQYQIGFTNEACTLIGQPGYRGYVIFDNNYEQNITKYPPMGCRYPIRPDMPNVDRMPETLAPHDWRVAANKSIEQGIIKKADSIEGLAEALGLKPQKLTTAVDKWNGYCADGADPELNFPPDWLIPVSTAPFYGAVIGGQIESTKCGLKVNEKMQVLDENCNKIAGLYAACNTAGGAIGMNNQTPESVLGSCGLSWTTGYIAAGTITDEEA